VSASDALTYLARRRRRRRLGKLTFGDVAYQIEIVGIPGAALIFLGFWAESHHVDQVPVPSWLQWAVSAVLAAYAFLRVLSAAGLGPVRLTPAEAQLLVAAPVPARRFLVPKLASAVGREALGAVAVALAWSAQTAVVLGSPFGTTLVMGLAGLVPFTVGVVAAAWLVENSPRAQRAIRTALPRIAWLPAVAVVAAPFVVRGLVARGAEGSSPAAYLWGPWAWAGAPLVRATEGVVAPAGAVAVAVLAIPLALWAVHSAGRPAIEPIALRSRLLASRPALRFFRDTVGLHAVRRQLWTRAGATGLRSGHPRRPGMTALVWKSGRHLLREGTGSWGLPLACALAVGLAAEAQPAVAVATALVLLYLPASRLVSPMLTDLENLPATSQLPFSPAVRVLAALAAPAAMLCASGAAAGLLLALTGEMAPERAVSVAAAMILGMLVALVCAAFGVVPRDLSALFLLPQELAFLARYPGQVMWLALVAATVAVTIFKGAAFGTAAGVAAVAIAARVLVGSYTHATAAA